MIDNLTLDQMRVLIAVAEAGSFSAAARRLGRVQSAASQAMQKLEENLQLTLFDRSGKTPTLTDAGRMVLSDARQVVQRAEALRTHAEGVAGGIEPELALAVDPFFPTDILMGSLRALQYAFPALPVTLLTEGLGATEQRLRDRQAHFAIYSILTTGAEDLEADFLTHIAMVPVVAADHPLAGELAPLSREVLEQHIQLVVTDRSSLTPKSAGRDLQHSYLAVCGPLNPSRLPSRRLRVVPHALAYGSRTHSRGTAQAIGHQPKRGAHHPAACGSSQRRASWTGKPLACC